MIYVGAELCLRPNGFQEEENRGTGLVVINFLTGQIL